jgi:hypothetical protein
MIVCSAQRIQSLIVQLKMVVLYSHLLVSTLKPIRRVLTRKSIKKMRKGIMD